MGGVELDGVGFSRVEYNNNIVAVLIKEEDVISRMAAMAFILTDRLELFSGRCIEGLRGIHLQSLGKIPLLVTEEIG